MKQQRKYREPKDTVWGKCLSGFIAIVFAVSTLTIIPIASAALGSSTDSELMQEAEKEKKKEKSSGQEDSAKVIEKAEITTLALENEKDEQQKQNEGQEDPVTGLAARLSSSSATYNALQQEPEVIVTKNGQQLESKDYTYTWSSEDGHDKLWFHAGKYNCHVFVDGREIASLEYNISPAPLTVVTDSAKKKYDGTPLTAPGHVEGLLMNHDSDDTGTVTVTTTSSQTEVGTSANMEYTVAYKSSFIENDYRVVNEEFGTLTVYCEHEDWAENDGRWVYEDVATATCTKPGAYTKSCPVCKTIISKTETPAHGHSFEKVEWADDTEDGIHQDGCNSTQHKKVCEWCNGTESGGIEYAEHNYGNEWKTIVEATIDSNGLKSRACADCSHVQFEIIPMLPSCPVYWFDGYTSQVLQEGKVLKGDTSSDTEDNAKALANPANPSRAGYEFLGWGLPVYDKDSVTITATWRLLTARWIDEDGTEIAKADFKLSDDGLTASEPEYVGTVPTKAEDDDNTYEFAGWVVDSRTDAGDVTYKATYTAIPKYTVTWVDGYSENPVIDSVKVASGTEYTGGNPADPTREGYRFADWSERAIDEAGNITITAQWVKLVTVSWYDGYNQGAEAVIDTETVDEDQVPAADTQSAPIRPETEYFTYDFNGWNEATDTHGNVTYTAQWTVNPKMITVTWLKGYDDGTDPVIDSTTAYKVNDYTGGNPANPTREGYDFAGWSEPTVDDAGNITFTALWTAVQPDDPTVPVVPTDPTNPIDPTNPVTPPTPGDGTVTTDTPAGPAVAPAVATPADAAAPAAAAAAVAAVEAIGDAENPLADITTIDDDANALAAFEEIHCWTHWLMLFGALVTIVYGLGVLYARRHSARDMDDFEDHIMGRKREEQAVESRVSNGAFQAM